MIDHAPILAPDLHFRLLKNAGRKEPLSAAPNVTEQRVATGTNSPGSMWFLPEFAALSECDVFHATANILPARIRSPTVTTVHDIMWLTNPDWCDSSMYGQIKRRFFAHGIRRGLSRSNRIATVSAATRDAILQHYPDCADRIAITQSGVSERFKPVAVNGGVNARLGMPEGAQYALIVGQFAPYKNHEGAVRAFAKAFAGQADARLVLVQRQGAKTQRLERLARRIGVGGQISFTGAVEEELLLRLYSGAKFLLHPSFCEGFGNPIAEAMACGCPVITSNRSAMPEVAGGAAKLVDPSSDESIARAMIEVWNDPRQSVTMREAGLKRASDLRWVDFARANVEIYRSILDGPRSDTN